MERFCEMSSGSTISTQINGKTLILLISLIESPIFSTTAPVVTPATNASSKPTTKANVTLTAQLNVLFAWIALHVRPWTKRMRSFHSITRSILS